MKKSVNGMKKIYGLLIFTALVSGVKAQMPDHVPLMNTTWDLLQMMTYKPNAQGKYVAYFPPDLVAMNKKVIELPGYMIPIKAGLVHDWFMLSVLPVLQCQFCGQGNIPNMVEVRLLKPIPYTENPFNVKGTLILNATDQNKSEFILENATISELK
jgi:hypothetical protein